MTGPVPGLADHCPRCGNETVIGTGSTAEIWWLRCRLEQVGFCKGMDLTDVRIV